MPKISNKFTATFTVKVGKTPIEVKVPVDFSQVFHDATPDAVTQDLENNAANQLSELMAKTVFKFKNQADFKRAIKAYRKANPAPVPTPSAD